MKSTMLLSAALMASSALAAPLVDNVVLSQDNSRKVKITYKLTGEQAIVTVDIQTNGVSIGEANLTHFAGDVNRVVQPSKDGSDIRTAFQLQERKKYWLWKWENDHRWTWIVLIAVHGILQIVAMSLDLAWLHALIALAAIGAAIFLYNRRSDYVEHHLYDDMLNK